MRTGIIVKVSATDRTRLEAVVADRNSPQKHVWRAQIVLLTTGGRGTSEIMRRTGKAKSTVWRWQERFMRAGVDGLLGDKTRPSRSHPCRRRWPSGWWRLRSAILPARPRTGPPPSRQRSAGSAPARCGASGARTGSSRTGFRRFQLSNDPQFAAKLRDIVGLYVDPPTHAVVLSVDEKSQIQALDRTPPGLPLKKGRCGTMTHDHIRNGTTTLFAALDVLEGHVIGRCMQRHRHQEFIRFLHAIEAGVATGKVVHVILDNCATRKHPKVRKWLERHPGFVFHFTPTPTSWLNAVEGFFAKLTKRRLKRGVFHSLVALQAAINRFVGEANADPRPFRWTRDPNEIIAAVRRGHQALEPIH